MHNTYDVVRLSTVTPTKRRGRLPAAEREQREQAILDAALAVLVEDGVGGLTMLAVARRAGASKETLYAWFGDRTGVLRALIERNADRSAAAVTAALADDRGHREVLVDYATGLLTLLTSPSSVALNRAAMTDAELAAALLAGGRHRIGPIVEGYLAALSDAGMLEAPDPSEAFRLFYGLVVRDVQITVLLGDDPPAPPAARRAAEQAVDRFLRLTAPSDATS